ncbi:MAG TPA: Rrf2 family transcriptional regulator [bacterium]|uniref:HTH-type transcriptional repressor NsrR n=1 Tax=candidate division TA06 bacterium ADurb.Bin417 TaxID=1852828 RepID=A0A1V5MIX9_UNCT6|nr:MAG: HTH-type transcriptional repressor NsrR [candidate division TA06 bacterium ADurb.Bin417]HNQ35032.1 Rrf2 family transcriptional regulator [bacterium]HNS49178.1 Rrf2 family transcriptional regulator [bacterium]
MKLLTKNSDYAVRALLILARAGDGYLSSRELAGREKIPLAYIRQVLHGLVDLGLVEAREGARGGVRLRRDPDQIPLELLIRHFQGGLTFSECLFRKKFCRNRSGCVLRRRLLELEEEVVERLKGVTIGTLLDDLDRKEGKPGRPVTGKTGKGGQDGRKHVLPAV